MVTWDPGRAPSERPHSGVVILACAPGDESATREAMAATGLATVEQRTASPNRLVLQAEAPSPDAARAAVARLRAAGLHAIEGPHSPGQQLGWENRNAPAWFASDACVCFPWSPPRQASPTTVVEIDPGGGFGSGRHPSTLLLLAAVADHGCHGAQVLDVGCGSGVLAVTAALFGAGAVTAIDIVPAAVSATVANAELNGVTRLVTASTDPLEQTRGTFDVVLANIHAPVLAAMAGDLRRALAPGGWLGLSGVSRAQVSMVAAAMRPLAIVDQTEADDWVALVLR